MAPIQSITLERDCSGCPTGTLLTLRRDGSVTYVQTGKERLGTVDKSSRGALGPVAFERLARMLLAQGFFDLRDNYEDPELRDGTWSTISVSRADQEKKVFRRDQAGPANLKAIEAAIESAQAEVKFESK